MRHGSSQLIELYKRESAAAGNDRKYWRPQPRDRVKSSHLHLPSSSGGTSFEVIERITMNEVPFIISTSGAENVIDSLLIFIIVI